VPHGELAICGQTRFDTVRNFSLFAHAEEPAHEVPPAGVFGRGKRPRPTPTIIEPEQVRAIMAAALDLPPKAQSAHTPTIACSDCWQRQA
jgi:integrase